MLAGLIAIASPIALSAGQVVPRPPHVGAYIPNSQLLAWCKGKEASDYYQCLSFITGVMDAAGNTSVTWPKGWIDVPTSALSNKIKLIVTAYLEKMPAQEMSGPAAESVYEALVQAYPYRDAPIATE